MNPVALKCLLGLGAVAGAAGGGVGVVYWRGGFSGLSKGKEEIEKVKELGSSEETSDPNESEKKDLLEEKLKDYGIPEKCIKDKKINQCSLSAEDLSKIKFHGFPEDGETEVTPLWVGDAKKNWEHNQSITLTFKDRKYIFDNYFPGRPRDNQLAHRPIKITRGNSSVTLDGNMKSEFTVEEDGLKKEEVNVLGFPKRCEIGDKERNECVLSENDIRRLRIKEAGISPDLLYGTNNNNKKMKLKIEKTTDQAYPDGKKYILVFMGDLYVMFLSTDELNDEGMPKTRIVKTLQFFKNSKKMFKSEDKQLIEVN